VISRDRNFVARVDYSRQVDSVLTSREVIRVVTSREVVRAVTTTLCSRERRSPDRAVPQPYSLKTRNRQQFPNLSKNTALNFHYKFIMEQCSWLMLMCWSKNVTFCNNFFSLKCLSFISYHIVSYHSLSFRGYVQDCKINIEMKIVIFA